MTSAPYAATGWPRGPKPRPTVCRVCGYLNERPSCSPCQICKEPLDRNDERALRGARRLGDPEYLPMFGDLKLGVGMPTIQANTRPAGEDRHA